MSMEQTTNAGLIEIAARQRELRAAEERADAQMMERVNRRHFAFNETGIPELLEAVKQIYVLHPDAKFVYLEVPLQRWFRPVYVENMVVGLRAAPLTWLDDPIIVWKTVVNGDGKIGYEARRLNRSTHQYKTAKELKATFVDWLTGILPQSAFAELEISALETPNNRRRVIKRLSAHAASN